MALRLANAAPNTCQCNTEQVATLGYHQASEYLMRSTLLDAMSTPMTRVFKLFELFNLRHGNEVFSTMTFNPSPQLGCP